MSAPPVLAAAALRALSALDDLPDGAALDLGAAAAVLDEAAPALAACQAYDHWMREVARLTEAIRDCDCPREGLLVEFDPDTEPADLRSHFRMAREEEAAEQWREGGRPLRLEEVAAVTYVRECPACSRLCQLIAERRHARQRLGVAKRAVRRAGRSS